MSDSDFGDRMPGDLSDVVPALDDSEDADELSGEAEVAPATLAPTELAGDDDYDALEEPLAEDPKDL